MGRGGALIAVLLVLAAFAAAPVVAQCPQYPRDCYELIPGEEEPLEDPDTDLEGVASDAGLYEDDDEGEPSEASFFVFRNAQATHGGSPRYERGDTGGVAFVFGPGQSDAGDRTHVNITVEVPDSLQGVTWTNGTSRSFQYDLEGQLHYEAMPFTVGRTGGDLVFIYTVTAHPGEDDEVSQSATLVLLAASVGGDIDVPAGGAVVVLLGVLLARRWRA